MSNSDGFVIFCLALALGFGQFVLILYATTISPLPTQMRQSAASMLVELRNLFRKPCKPDHVGPLWLASRWTSTWRCVACGRRLSGEERERYVRRAAVIIGTVCSSRQIVPEERKR